ncbi:MAG: hypothetical protein H0X30_11665 [Anaerolineae bacterium]|nr:hypothetical protein [Anaerolineae bacterium]
MKKAFLALLAIVVVVGGCFGLFTLSTYAVGYFVRGTRPIPGDAAKFDPIAAYPDIAKFAGDNVQVERIEMKFVKSNGTLDLTGSYGAEVDYRFVHILDNAPDNAAPLGAGGKPGGTYAEHIYVNVVKPGASGGAKNQYYNFGMTHQVIAAQLLTEPTAEPPTCSAKQLWDIALKNDAPANAVATINYDSTGYRFSIKDTSVNLQFDTSCNLIK